MIEFQPQPIPHGPKGEVLRSPSPRPSPLANPAIKEFLNGLAEIIVQDILDGEDGLLIEDDSTFKQGGQPC